MLVIIILFWGKKIPELSRRLGKGLQEFRETTKELKDEVNSVVEDMKSVVDESQD